jgi:serine/threonine protein kinase
MDDHGDEGFEADEIKPDYLAPGTRVGDYTILDKLGQGGFGAAYKVSRGDRYHVLKVSLGGPTARSRKDHNERLRREFGTLVGLDHPHVVKVFGCEVLGPLESGFPYIVMEYVEGYRLFDWQAQLQPSLRTICTVMAKLAGGLEAAHVRKITHRDVKNENILVGAGDEPKLIDFGIARTKAAYTLTAAQVLIGTMTHLSAYYHAYAWSPDGQAGKQFPYYVQLDLYALGVTLYELLTGRLPWTLDEPSSTSQMAGDAQWTDLVCNEPPYPPRFANESIPGNVEEFILKLIAKEPDVELTAAVVEKQFLEMAATDDPSWDKPFEIPGRSRQANAGTRKGRKSRSGPGAVAGPRRVSGDQPAHNSGEKLQSDATPAPAPSDRPPSTSRAPGSRSGERAPTASIRGNTPRVASAQVEAPDRPHTQTFHDDVQDAAEEPVAPERKLPTAIRQMRKQVEAKPSRVTPLQMVLGVLALVLVAMFAAPALLKPKEGESLTKKYAAPPPEPSAAIAQAEPPRPVPSAPLPQAKPTSLPPAPVSALPASPPPSTKASRAADAAKVDQLLREQYGRPRVPGPGEGSTAAPAPTPAPAQPKGPFRTVVMSDAAPAPSGGSQLLHIPRGERIHVKLKTPLDSRTASSGLVEALVVSNVIAHGDIVIPRLSRVYGTAQTNGGRFAVHFTTIRLPDNSEVKFNGLAYDKADGKSGLMASRTIAGAAPSGDSVGAQVGKNVVGAALGQVGGTASVDIARGAAQTAMTARDPDAAGGSQNVSMVDAPVDFDIFVQEPF